MLDPFDIGYYDPAEAVERTERNLPHWFQPNVATFITFRTADSLPKHVVMHWYDEQRAWLREHGWPIETQAELPDWRELPKELQAGFWKERAGRWHWHLDTCHGKCELRARVLATIVLNSLRHFDGQRYDLDCAIVMPNHVHLLVQFRPGTDLRDQCNGWLHYTARQINQHLGRKGAFWQSEPFDHLVRSAAQFEYLRGYIAENGIRANLPETDYLYWKAGPM